MCGFRYIDQCQDLLDAPGQIAETDLDLYTQTVGAGGMPDWPDEIADESFVAYVERGTVAYLVGRKDSLPVAFNYDRWISGRGL